MPETRLTLNLDRFVRRLHAMLHARATSFDTQRIGPGGAIILLTLADMEPVEMQALTVTVARDKSQMTRAVRALEEKGMLTRKVSDRDARVTILSLTEAGHALVAAHRAALSDCLDELLAPLAEADRASLRLLMQKIAG